MKRREFIASCAIGILTTRASGAGPINVPFSNGIGAPQLNLPRHACDCHMHIYDDRFPAAPTATLTPPNASVDDYRKLQARLGCSRNIVVTPSTYGTDNRVTLAAIEAFGPTARGVAVVGPDVTTAELRTLDQGGIRGIRFNLTVGAFLSPEMIAPLAARIADLGWHVQLNMTPETLIAMEETLLALPTPIVLDHIARIPQPEGTLHPAYSVVRRLLEKGHGWVKLSGPYISSKDGSADFADAGRVASAFADAAPERVLWGSDWPHPTKTDKPDDAELVDLIETWIPKESEREKLFFSNPALLFGFDSK